MAINKELGNFAWLARNLCSLAEICIKRNKIDSALANYREAIAIYVQLNDNQSLMFAVGNVGNLFMETGRNDSAIVSLIS